MTRDDQIQRWKTLAGLLDVAERGGLAKLTVPETLQMARLYRQTAIDLSRARAAGAHPDEINYLNLLAARAHGQVYQSRPPKLLPGLKFLATGFPRMVRRHYLPILVSAGVFLGSALASFVAVVQQPLLAFSLFDEDYVEFENLRLEKQHGEYKGNFTFSREASPLVAVTIIGNNILVALRTFAFGALLGLPCVYLMVYNGRMLGTLQAMMFTHGYFIDFHSLILTHGVLELSAIVIAGGGGLLLGWSVIAPGARSRRDSLRAAAAEAAGLLAGACAMLVIAGVVEAYVTPHYSAPVRWTVGQSSAVLLALYIFQPKRRMKSVASAVPHRGLEHNTAVAAGVVVRPD